MKAVLVLFTALALLLPSAIAFNCNSLSGGDLAICNSIQNTNFNEIDFSIKTDKINYFDNDTIKVYISPANLQVNIIYANKTIITKNYTELKAVLYENKISAKIGDKEQYALVNVNKREDFNTLYQLCALFFVGYICYKVTKGYVFKILEAI